MMLRLIACILLLAAFICGGSGAAVQTCGPVPQVDHATPVNNTDSSSVSTKVRYTCNELYSHTGRRKANRCQQDGTWTNNVECQYNSTIGCHHKDRPRFTKLEKYPKVLKWTFPEDTVAHVRCTDGYSTENAENSEVVCTPAGRRFEWRGIGMFLDCKPKSCGNPGFPEYGGKNSNVYTTASLVEFHCDEGYELHGPKRITCLVDGEWSGSFPTCERVCYRPALDHTNFNPSKRYYQDDNQVTVSCKAGYKAVQGALTTATCSNGHWMPRTPVACEAKSCVALGQLANGQKNSSAHITGSKVQFKCNEGYKLKGKAVITCQVNGAWSESVPICKVCCQAPAFEHTNVNPEETYYGDGDEVIVSCNEGYQAASDTPMSARCSNGDWTTETPIECNAKSCGVLGRPDHGDKDSDDHTTGSQVWFTCREGYELEGMRTITCQANGEWSGKVPSCNAKSCGVLGRPDHGDKDSDDHTTGSQVQFTCREGYKLEGMKTITCQANGEWSGKVPSCNALQLESQPNPCREPNYHSNTICGPLPKVDHGCPTANKSSTVQKVRYECEPGYNHTGQRKANKCQKDGTWTQNVKCTYDSTIGCSLNNLPDHTSILHLPKVLQGSYPKGTKGDVQCGVEDGVEYTRETRSPTNSEVSCTQTGSEYHWQGDGMRTTCAIKRERSCDPITPPAGITFEGITFVNRSLAKHGSLQKFTCNVGHFTAKGLDDVGDDVNYNRVECLNGQFSPTPRCEGVTSCDRSAPYDGIRFELSGMTPNGAKNMFTCTRHGYVAVGLDKPGNNKFNYVNCVNGRFNPTPRCEEPSSVTPRPRTTTTDRSNGKVEPESPTVTPTAPAPDTSNGDVDQGGASCDRSIPYQDLKFYYHGQAVNGSKELFQCTKSNFVAVGIDEGKSKYNSVYCINGRFNPTPSCIPPSCPRPTDTNLRRFLTDHPTQHDHSADFECLDDATTRAGEKTGRTKCVEGKWTPEPVCQRPESSCTKPAATSLLRFTTTPPTPHNGWARFECLGSALTPDHLSYGDTKCVDGKWTPIPVCRRSESSCTKPAATSLLRFTTTPPTPHNGWARFECLGSALTPDNLSYGDTKCMDGKWTPTPVCRRPESSCSRPEDTTFLRFSYFDITPHTHWASFHCLRDALIEHKWTSGNTQCVNGIWTPTPVCSRPGCNRSMRLHVSSSCRHTDALLIGNWKKWTTEECVIKCHENSECTAFEYDNVYCRFFRLCTPFSHNAPGLKVYKKYHLLCM